jgi:branched-chain amino acid transport system permease protein
MLSSGLTLIFSMMGVLNFAHAGFYMLGAYAGYTISRIAGFWPALVLAPLAVGAAGALFERACLRRVHKDGHVAELLVTFGLGTLILELVQLVWGRAAVAFDPPAWLARPAFTLVQTAQAGLSVVHGRADPATCAQAACSPFPATRTFMMAVALLMLLALWLLLTRTRARPRDPGRAHASADGRGARPRRAARVHARASARAARSPAWRRDRRHDLRHRARDGRGVGSILFVVVVVGGTGSLVGAFVGSLLIGLLQTCR